MLRVGPYPWLEDGRCKCRQTLDSYWPPGRYLWVRFPDSTGPLSVLREAIRLDAVAHPSRCLWEGTFEITIQGEIYAGAVSVWYEPTSLVGVDVSWIFSLTVFNPFAPFDSRTAIGGSELETKWESGRSADAANMDPTIFTPFPFRDPGGVGALAETLYGYSGRSPFDDL